MTEPEFPRFSDAEFRRRHLALASALQEQGADHLLVVTDQRTGNAPQWVTGWPGTVEAFVVFAPGEQISMHVEWFNHVPLAKRMVRVTRNGFESLHNSPRGFFRAADRQGRAGFLPDTIV